VVDADSPINNAALIGGIVGGIVAFLLVGGLVAFLFARSRQRSKGEASIGAALVSINENQNNGRGVIGAKRHRSKHESLPMRPPNSDYGVFGPTETALLTNGASPQPSPRSEYECGDVTKF
jgi:hypothetical protein